MRIRILLFTIITLFAIKLPTISQDTVNQTIEDHITIDGRTYKVSSDFTIPPGIDKDSPVRLVFTDDTHELLSIERLTDDDSNNDDLEYHFGIVNAISRANTDMEYRVYLDGTGYLFSKDTHIDERTAFLEKYASAALVTRHGKVLVCKVLASNTAVPEKDIFWGEVEDAEQSETLFTITVNGVKHALNAGTETTGQVMIPGTWVFGYETGGTVRSVSVIADSFPDPASVQSFTGIVSFIGNVNENGSFYVTVNGTTLHVLPDSLCSPEIVYGDYAAGFRIGNDIFLMSRIPKHYGKSETATTDQYLYSGYVSEISTDTFRIDGRILYFDLETRFSGHIGQGKYALASISEDHAGMVYMLPDSYSDYDYQAVSGIISGLGPETSGGQRTIRLDEDIFFMDQDTRILKNPAYGEVGTALYKGASRISVIDVLSKPADEGIKISGTINSAKTAGTDGSVIITTDRSEYVMPPTAVLSGSSDFSRLAAGAVIEGYAFGNEVLALKIVRGAGLIGILNPPWMEYAAAGLLISAVFLILILKVIRNRTSWHTGSLDIGSGDTIILHEGNGQINSYEADQAVFDLLTSLHERSVTVKVRQGKIIEVR